MKKMKIYFSAFTILLILYCGASYILLDGKLIYYTSFNEDDISSSKKENLFVSNELEIIIEGDSLRNLNDKIMIWTNKRYKVKYYGILFYWTYTEPDWRYLNIKFKDEFYPYLNDWCMKNKLDKGYSACCNSIGCKVGDNIELDFIKCMNESMLGTIKVIIE